MRLNIGRTAHREYLEHDKPAAILAEVLDTNLLHRLAASVGLGKSGLATVTLAQDERGDAVLHQLYETIERPFEKLGPRLRQYVEYREDGHTKECLLTALTNPPSLLSISDLHLRIMAANEPALPVSWWRKDEDVIRNLDAKQEKEVAFVHIDGGIAWLYILRQTRLAAAQSVSVTIVSRASGICIDGARFGYEDRGADRPLVRVLQARFGRIRPAPRERHTGRC